MLAHQTPEKPLLQVPLGSSVSVSMHEQLLLSTICPVFGTPLEVASRALTNRLNGQIGALALRSLIGRTVCDPAEHFLIDAEQRIAYPVREGIPVLKSYEAIPLTSTTAFPTMSPQDYRKLVSEFDFWVNIRLQKGPLIREDAYLHVVERDFQHSRGQFRDKRILDIGCGPLGSLEWAELASLRVGLDPLAGAYRQLGTGSQQMDYVAADAERIPFPSRFFDFVFSFNSLDHVDNLDAAIAEIIRVLAPGGSLFLVSDIHDEPTVNEPTTFDWNIVRRFAPLTAEREIHLEKKLPGVYESLAAGVPFLHQNPAKRYGIIVAQLRKPLSMEQRVPSAGDIYTVGTTAVELQRIVRQLPAYAQNILFHLLQASIEHSTGGQSLRAQHGFSDTARDIFSKPPHSLTGEAIEQEIARYYMRYGVLQNEILNAVIELIGDIARRVPQQEQPRAMSELLRGIFGDSPPR